MNHLYVLQEVRIQIIASRKRLLVYGMAGGQRKGSEKQIRHAMESFTLWYLG